MNYENYQEIKNMQPTLKDCFFAFSEEQMKIGIEKFNLHDKKVYSGGMGLYGTKEGIKALMLDYDRLSAEITNKCDPQEVYNYEFYNHECSYTCEDTEAMQLVISYFGIEKAKTIKRKYAYKKIEDFEIEE